MCNKYLILILKRAWFSYLHKQNQLCDWPVNSTCDFRKLTLSPGVLCSVSFLRLGVWKLPVADLTTTPGAVVESSPKGKSNIALPQPSLVPRTYGFPFRAMDFQKSRLSFLQQSLGHYGTYSAVPVTSRLVAVLLTQICP